MVNAVENELTVLYERGTWTLVPRPERVNVLPSKFVLKIKRHPDGTVDRYKARFVVLGCNQNGEQFDKLYSPALDFTTLRLELTIAGIEGSYIHQMDVKSA